MIYSPAEMREQIKEYIKTESEQLASKILEQIKKETDLYIVYHLPVHANPDIVEMACFLLERSGWVVKNELTSIRIGPKEDQI